MFKTSKSILFFLILLPASISLYAQEDICISGKIIEIEGTPVVYAAIEVKGTKIFCYSNSEGVYKLNVPPGKVELIVSSLGYRTLVQSINVDNKTREITLIMQKESLHLDEVEVTAKTIISNKGSSCYHVGNQAVEQIQAMSLGDILTLLPGNRLKPPSMNSVQQANLRTASPSKANAFGTSVIVDGLALNNDANLQAKNPSSSISGGNSTVGRGIDLRTISAAGIESIEVITGVPSARYGNITSGAIIVKNKIGKSPLYASANLTSTSYQGTVTKGYELARNKGILNTNLSYTYSNASPINRKTYYNNVDFGIRWHLPIQEKINWNNTTSFLFGLSDDGQRVDSDELYRNTSDVRSQSYSLSVNGFMNVLGKLSYAFNGNIINQYSYFHNTGVNGPVPIVEGLETGTYFSEYTPAIYTQITKIKGLPVTFSGDLSLSQNITPEDLRISFSSGLQFNYSKNKGKGRVISGGVSLPAGVSGSRSAKFHKLPASQSFSLWNETNIKLIKEKKMYSARLGLRYDYMNMRYNLLSPRLSFSASFSDAIQIRGAWGISYKAPALIQLYPGPVYYDYTNLSYFAPNPLERLAITSTYVYQPDNSNLKPSKGKTFELGFDIETKPITVRVTAFHKELSRGIYHSPNLLLLYRQNYEVISAPKNKKPIVKEITGDIDTLIRSVYIPKNVYTARTNGVELTIIPLKINSTNTRFNINFSYMKTTTFDDGYNLKISSYVIGSDNAKWGVYQNNKDDIYLSTGNITMIQQIPSLGLVFNLTAELNFTDYEQTRTGSLYPYAYYSSDGEYHEIPEGDRTSATYADLKLPDNTYEVYSKPPFYTNYHLQVRKETAKGHSFSFFANNVFWHNPVYERKGTRRALNSTISYGFAMKFKL